MADKSYGSRFLYSEDFLRDERYVSPTLEISAVYPPGVIKAHEGTKAEKPIQKWVIGVKGRSEKLLVLCKTSRDIIHNVTGIEPGDGWVGKQVKLQVRIVPSFGTTEPAIRVMPPKGTPLRRELIKHLGTEAVYQGTAT